jgi:hypothetical protein
MDCIQSQMNIDRTLQHFLFRIAYILIVAQVIISDHITKKLTQVTQ